MPAYQYPHHAFVRPPEMRGDRHRHAVAIAGGGPVGLTLALDLAQRGVRSVVLQASDTLSEGSRALCWSQRTLDILDRLGAAESMVKKGFTWNQGRVFYGSDEVFSFDLQPERNRKFPAFINLQQYYGEEYMVAAVQRAANSIDLRWQSRVVGLRQEPDHVALQVETPEGAYWLECDHLAACDGAKSSVRRVMGLPWEGRVFEDHFLIADVDVGREIPWSERRFWFLPAFHQGETALCHRQGDGMWRVDFQLGWDGVDPEAELKPEKAIPRIKAMLGDVPVELTWLSLYTFQCRRLERFRYGRVLFAGDAAHQVSPFGARGGNSGIQDAENLGWKLALVLDGRAPDRLLDSYHDERSFAADENIRITCRTTDFMTGRTRMRRLFREAVLTLARQHPFARQLINSGRLSTPTVHCESPLNSDSDVFHGGIPVGAPCPNVMLADGSYLLDGLGRGLAFELLHFGGGSDVRRELEALQDAPVPVEVIAIGGERGSAQHLPDPEGRLARVFAAAPGTTYLLRPDQHVAGRWRRFDAPTVRAAVRRALSLDPED